MASNSAEWTPRSRWPPSPETTASGVAPMPTWMVAPSGTISATWAAIRRSTSPIEGEAYGTSGRSVSTQASTRSRAIVLSPRVRGIRWLTSAITSGAVRATGRG